jgi:hypothetical protein
LSNPEVSNVTEFVPEFAKATAGIVKNRTSAANNNLVALNIEIKLPSVAGCHSSLKSRPSSFASLPFGRFAVIVKIILIKQKKPSPSVAGCHPSGKGRPSSFASLPFDRFAVIELAFLIEL